MIQFLCILRALRVEVFFFARKRLKSHGLRPDFRRKIQLNCGKINMARAGAKWV
jgi:hypothetical protein